MSTSRSWTIEIPLWVPGVRGQLSYGDVELEDDNSAGNGSEGIFSKLFNTGGELQFYFAGRGMFDKNKFFAYADMFMVAIGGHVKFVFKDSDLVTLGLNGMIIRFAGGYTLLSTENNKESARFEIKGYLGSRIYVIKLNSNLGNYPEELHIHPAWTEPILGIYAPYYIKKWLFLIQVDAGGFNLTKSNSYMLHFTTGYRMGKVVSMKLSWSILNMKYKSVLDEEDLDLNLRLTGPALSVGFHF